MPVKPLVSVIIPTYNRADFLVEAIQSVINQSYSPIEVLIKDDGSSDDTYTRIKPFLKSNSANHHCRYLYTKERIKL